MPKRFGRNQKRALKKELCELQKENRDLRMRNLESMQAARKAQDWERKALISLANVHRVISEKLNDYHPLLARKVISDRPEMASITVTKYNRQLMENEICHMLDVAVWPDEFKNAMMFEMTFQNDRSRYMLNRSGESYLMNKEHVARIAEQLWLELESARAR